MTLGLVILTAALTWVFLPEDLVSTAWIGGALAGAGLGIWLSFMRVCSPPLVMLYAVAQGFFLGAASEAFEQMWPGIVAQAVVGTICAFIATLAAYKFFNIQVTTTDPEVRHDRGLGFFVLVFGDFLLSLFDAELGFNELRHARPDHERRRPRPRYLLPDPRLRHDRAGGRDGRPGERVVASRVRA